MWISSYKCSMEPMKEVLMKSLQDLNDTQKFIVMKSFLLELGRFKKPSDRDKFLFKALQKKLQLSKELFQEAKLEVRTLLPKERVDGIIDLKSLMTRVKSDLAIQLAPTDLLAVLEDLREVLNVAGNIDDQFMEAIRLELNPPSPLEAKPAEEEEFLLVDDEEEDFDFQPSEEASGLAQVELPPKQEVIDSEGLISLPGGPNESVSAFQDFTSEAGPTPSDKITLPNSSDEELPAQEVENLDSTEAVGQNPITLPANEAQSTAQEENLFDEEELQSSNPASKQNPVNSVTSSLAQNENNSPLGDSGVANPASGQKEIESVNPTSAQNETESPGSSAGPEDVSSESSDSQDQELAKEEEFEPEGKLQEILFKLKLHNMNWDKLFAPIQFAGPLIRNQCLKTLQQKEQPKYTEDADKNITCLKLRTIAALIDAVFATYFCLPFFILMGVLTGIVNFLGLSSLIIILSTLPIGAGWYYFYRMESLHHATFGKQLLGMKIVNLGGKEPSKKEIFKRNLPRLLPAPLLILTGMIAYVSSFLPFDLSWPFFALQNIAFLLLTLCYLYVYIQSERRGIHDLFAKTMVAQVSNFPGWHPPKPPALPPEGSEDPQESDQKSQ